MVYIENVSPWILKGDVMDKKTKKETNKSKDREKMNDCCYVIDPCGCYMVDPCGCMYVDPCCC